MQRDRSVSADSTGSEDESEEYTENISKGHGQQYTTDEILQIKSNKILASKLLTGKLSDYFSACPLKLLYVENDGERIKFVGSLLQKLDPKIRATLKMSEEAAIGISRSEVFDLIILEESSYGHSTAGKLRLNGYTS